MRGEYYLEEWKERFYLGSPPLARGILLSPEDVLEGEGITPACAGNTVENTVDFGGAGDHPRLRGEYWFCVSSHAT